MVKQKSKINLFRLASSKRLYVPRKPPQSFIENFNDPKNDMAISLDAIDIFTIPPIAFNIVDAMNNISIPNEFELFFSTSTSHMKEYSIRILNALSLGAFKHYCLQFNNLYLKVTGKDVGDNKLQKYIHELYLKDKELDLMFDDIKGAYVTNSLVEEYNPMHAQSIYENDNNFKMLKCVAAFKVSNQILLKPVNKRLSDNMFDKIKPHLLAEYTFIIPIIERKEGTAATLFAKRTSVCKFDETSLFNFKFAIASKARNVYKSTTLVEEEEKIVATKYQLRWNERLRKRKAISDASIKSDLIIDDDEDGEANRFQANIDASENDKQPSVPYSSNDDMSIAPNNEHQLMSVDWSKSCNVDENNVSFWNQSQNQNDLHPFVSNFNATLKNALDGVDSLNNSLQVSRNTPPECDLPTAFDQHIRQLHMLQPISTIITRSKTAKQNNDFGQSNKISVSPAEK